MNQPELESILNRARLPEIPDESLEKFPRQIVSRIKREQGGWSSSFSLSARRPPVEIPLKHRLQRWFPRPVWSFAALICILAAFAIGHWSGRMKTQPLPDGDSLANLKLIRETLAMFPNRLRAIVQDERGLNLVLSDADDVPASPPLYVSICDGKKCSSFVTFSGQEIQVAGQKVMVLSDPRGGIILTGSQFVWSNMERTDVGNHLKIEAKNLGQSVM